MVWKGRTLKKLKINVETIDVKKKLRKQYIIMFKLPRKPPIYWIIYNIRLRAATESRLTLHIQQKY